MKRLGSLLLAGGVGVCLLGVIGLVGGMWVTLPPVAMQRIAMSLPFVVGVALLIIGALVGRAAERKRGLAAPRSGNDLAVGPMHGIAQDRGAAAVRAGAPRSGDAE